MLVPRCAKSLTSFGPQPGGGIFFCSTIRLCPPPPAKLMPILRKTHRRTACRSGRRKHLLQTKTALGVCWTFAWKETCYLDIRPGNAEVDLNLMFRSCPYDTNDAWNAWMIIDAICQAARTIEMLERFPAWSSWASNSQHT